MGKVDGPTRNLGHKVVMEVCKDILGKGYEVYFDNFFSSVQLAVDILKHGTTSVVTTQPDRVGFPKGEINKGSVHCFVWMGSKPVFLLTQFVDALYILQCLGGWQME